MKNKLTLYISSENFVELYKRSIFISASDCCDFKIKTIKIVKNPTLKIILFNKHTIF